MKHMTKASFLCCLVFLAGLVVAAALAAPFAVSQQAGAERKAGAGEYLVYVGTYTRGASKGIYAYRFNAATGEIAELGLAAETPNPSFLALHPNGKFVYAVSEVAETDGKKGGAVSAFAIDRATGRLNFLNRVSSGGAGPCHVNVDKSGRALLVANYGGGSVGALPIRADGRLGEAGAVIQHAGSSVNPKRQQAPHAHSVNLSPDNRFVIAADLGLDKLMVYRLDAATAALTPHVPPHAALKPGAGPRHFTFHPNGRYAYAINELHSTVSVFRYDAQRGAFDEAQTVTTLPEGFSGESYTAEVLVHPNGRFLYGSNRGHDSIAVFAIDQTNGTLSPVEHRPTEGKWPRNFNLDPAGAFLFAANQNSDSVVVFRVDQKTGRLTPTGQKLEVGSPVCVKFVAVK